MIRLATRADVDDIVLGYDALFDYEEVHGCFSNWRRGVYPLRSDVEAALAAGTLYVLREEGALITGIATTLADEERLSYFQSEMQQHFPDLKLSSAPLAMSIGCHTGPGAVGIGVVRVHKG